MPRVKYRCPVCDAPVLTERWEMGYNYCTQASCKEKLGVQLNIFESPPTPETSPDLSPWELEDVAAMYNDDSD